MIAIGIARQGMVARQVQGFGVIYQLGISSGTYPDPTLIPIPRLTWHSFEDIRYARICILNKHILVHATVQVCTRIDAYVQAWLSVWMELGDVFVCVLVNMVRK